MHFLIEARDFSSFTRSLPSYFQLLAKGIGYLFFEGKNSRRTRRIESVTIITRKVASLLVSRLIEVYGYRNTLSRPCLLLIYLICFFRSSVISLPFVPLSLFLHSLNPGSYGIRLNEADIHNGFAVVRWRGVPRRFFFFLHPPSIALPAKNIRAIIPRRRCLALGCL